MAAETQESIASYPIDAARSLEVDILDANMVLENNSAYVTGTMDTVADASAALDFVRSSPLQENMSFVSPGWQGSGRMNIAGELVIPAPIATTTPTGTSVLAQLVFSNSGCCLTMTNGLQITVRK